MQTFQCMPSRRTILKGGFREFTKKNPGDCEGSTAATANAQRISKGPGEGHTVLELIFHRA